ncbi:MAG: hypothetical protein IJV64_09770 [Oscillospiraceae bacterium]|nr:hypothetical protein [Oscillospiraceae bacterium]
MKEKARFSLSLYLDDPDQRETAELLKAIPPGQRTAYICRAVRWLHDQEHLMDAVRSMLREEMKNMPRGGQVEPTQADALNNEIEDDAVLNFLRALQGDDD